MSCYDGWSKEDLIKELEARDVTKDFINLKQVCIKSSQKVSNMISQVGGLIARDSTQIPVSFAEYAYELRELANALEAFVITKNAYDKLEEGVGFKELCEKQLEAMNG